MVSLLASLPGLARACALLVLALTATAAASHEVLVVSQSEGSTRVVADTLLSATTRHRLIDAGTPENAIEHPRMRDATLVLALGEAAAIALNAAPDTPPMLVALISAADYARLRQQGLGDNATALFIDQPLERHLRLIRAVLPDADCAGLVLGPHSRSIEPRIAQASQRSGLEVSHSFAASAGDVIPALERHLARCPAALTLTDPVVSHPNVARATLLTSYRMLRPLFAYSRAWVEAGALAAVFSTPATAARDLLDWLDALEDAAALPPARMATHFELAVNQRVARALGLQLPPEDSLRAALDAGGRP